MGFKAYVNVSVAAATANRQTLSGEVRVLNEWPTDRLNLIWELEVVCNTTNPMVTLSSEMNNSFSNIRITDIVAVAGGVDLLNRSGELSVPRVILPQFCNIKVLEQVGLLVRIWTSKGDGWVPANVLGFDSEPNFPFRITKQDGTLLDKLADMEHAKVRAGENALTFDESVFIHHISSPDKRVAVALLDRS